MSDKLSSVEIKLGRNVREISVSTNILRHMEFDRMTVTPKLQDVVDATELDKEEANATTDG
jgi:hypothetical protein